MKHIIAVSLLFIVVAGTAQFFNPQQQRFKNLKVLSQKLTEQQMDKIMDHYTIALGTDCNYCHNKNKTTGEIDYAGDEKGEKEIGRKMIKMTDEINKNYFNYNGTSIVVQSVTCLTCHQGQPIPVTDSLPAKKKD